MIGRGCILECFPLLQHKIITSILFNILMLWHLNDFNLRGSVSLSVNWGKQYLLCNINCQARLSKLLASLGHTVNTQTLMKTKINLTVLSNFMILYWAAFIAILGTLRPQVGQAW